MKDDNDLNKSLAKTDLNVAAIIDDGHIDGEMFVPKLSTRQIQFIQSDISQLAGAAINCDPDFYF